LILAKFPNHGYFSQLWSSTQLYMLHWRWHFYDSLCKPKRTFL